MIVTYRRRDLQLRKCVGSHFMREEQTARTRRSGFRSRRAKGPVVRQRIMGRQHILRAPRIPLSRVYEPNKMPQVSSSDPTSKA
jgi:hypothetical protein